MKYVNIPSVLTLVSLLRSHGVEHVVISPGSRNAPLVYSLVNDDHFICIPVTDERSAGFFAVGIAQTHYPKPVAVVCTSGSALLNLHSAVSEAYYSNLPLLVISADRPEAWVGQMDGQTLPQRGILESLTRKSVHLPEENEGVNPWYRNRLINEALLACQHPCPAPVHINIPLSEPLFPEYTDVLPKERHIHYYSTDNIRLLLEKSWNQYERKLFCIGQHHPTSNTSEEIQYYLDQLKDSVLIITEHLSNLKGDLFNPEEILAITTPKEKDALHPDLVITMEGHLLSKQLKEWLRANPPKEHWHISPRGEVVDLFGTLTAVISMQTNTFLSTLHQWNHKEQKPSIITKRYIEEWRNKSTLPCDPQSTLPTTALGIIQRAIHTMKGIKHLHLANSNTVRLLDYFSIPDNVVIHSNRGVNGIDGSFSSAVGSAISTPDVMHLLIIGDLSFFYEFNLVADPTMPNNLRILLLNNQGGAIFQGIRSMPTTNKAMNLISGVHQKSTQSFTGAFPFKSYFWDTKENGDPTSFFQEVFFQPSQEAILLEIPTDAIQDLNAVKEILNQSRK